MADVFEVLRLDHDELRRLLAQLHIGPTALTGATSNQLAAREELTGQLIAAESRHEAVEAQFFWPAVRRLGQEAEKLAGLAAGQEAEAAQALAALASLNVQAAEFEPVLTEVISAGLEHIDFEEQEVWPQLRQTISTCSARELGSEIALGLRRAEDTRRRTLPRG
jgi:hemerythrin-like domain-containing protein